ncbi:hypothetical protein GCM10027271_19490 [Saccharopolyspora gloriosae]
MSRSVIGFRNRPPMRWLARLGLTTANLRFSRLRTRFLRFRLSVLTMTLNITRSAAAHRKAS